VNKAELIEAIVKETELSKAAAGRALNAVLETIVKTVAKKQDVQLIGFGTFKAAKRAARTGKNPRTGEKLKISCHRPQVLCWRRLQGRREQEEMS